MGRRAISLITYDPYEDRRIDPKSSANIFSCPELPGHIHDAVARAKKLIGYMELEQLKAITKQLDSMVNGHYYRLKELESSDKDYVPADESDNLRAYLKYADHNYPDRDWPVLFGALALSLAGEIVNTLWPSKEYIAAIGGEVSLIQSVNPDYSPAELTEASRRHVQEFAVEAVRAVGFGEGFKVAFEFKHEAKSRASRAAKLRHQVTDTVKDEFIAYWLQLERDGVIKSKNQAAKDFRNSLPVLPNGRKISEQTLIRALRKHLK